VLGSPEFRSRGLDRHPWYGTPRMDRQTNTRRQWQRHHGRCRFVAPSFETIATTRILALHKLASRTNTHIYIYTHIYIHDGLLTTTGMLRTEHKRGGYHHRIRHSTSGFDGDDEKRFGHGNDATVSYHTFTVVPLKPTTHGSLKHTHTHTHSRNSRVHAPTIDATNESTK